MMAMGLVWLIPLLKVENLKGELVKLVHAEP